jgi:hypothetical protein
MLVYIKNISELLKDQLAMKLRLLEGSTIYGKIISLDEEKGAIKLYDGTLLPAIFISGDKLEEGSYKKFQIAGFNENNIILKLADNQNKIDKETSIENVLKNLNVPAEDGKKIIASLMKFNQFAGDENILKIYKSLCFIKNFLKMNDIELLNFLKETFNDDFNTSSFEFKVTKEIIASLQDVDTDLFSFMIENDVPTTLTNIMKAKDFTNEKFLLNTLIDKLYKELKLENSKNSIMPLDDVIEKIKLKPELLDKIPSELLSKVINNSSMLNYINSNYSVYLFNYYSQNNLFKNNIIIKNKYKNSKFIDVNDAKVYITVETPNTGIVEAFLSKKNNDLIVTLKVEKSYINIYRNKLNTLAENLKSKGYNILNITVEKLRKDKDSSYVDLSDFFNEMIFKELDVKV